MNYLYNFKTSEARIWSIYISKCKNADLNEGSRHFSDLFRTVSNKICSESNFHTHTQQMNKYN